MFSKAKYTPNRAPRPTGLVVALLAVLTLVVGIVTVYAMSRAGTSTAEGIPTTGAPKPAVTPTATPEPEATPEPSPEPTEEETPQAPEPITAVVPDRFITPVTDKVITRSMVGSCQQAGTLELSDDEGQTWTQSTALSATDSTMHLRVIPTRANMIQLVALKADCEPQLVRTQDQGETWLAASDPTGAWFFDPSTPNTIAAPDGPVPAPCSAVAMAASADNAGVLCADGSVITTNNKANSWKEPIAVSGAIAIGISSNDYILGVANQNECTGLQTIELKGSTLGSPSTCLESELIEGTVSVARTSNTVLAWFGNEFATLQDGGDTWH